MAGWDSNSRFPWTPSTPQRRVYGKRGHAASMSPGIGGSRTDDLLSGIPPGRFGEYGNKGIYKTTKGMDWGKTDVSKQQTSIVATPQKKQQPRQEKKQHGRKKVSFAGAEEIVDKKGTGKGKATEEDRARDEESSPDPFSSPVKPEKYHASTKDTTATLAGKLVAPSSQAKIGWERAFTEKHTSKGKGNAVTPTSKARDEEKSSTIDLDDYDLGSSSSLLPTLVHASSSAPPHARLQALLSSLQKNATRLERICPSNPNAKISCTTIAHRIRTWEHELSRGITAIERAETQRVIDINEAIDRDEVWNDEHAKEIEELKKAERAKRIELRNKYQKEIQRYKERREQTENTPEGKARLKKKESEQLLKSKIDMLCDDDDDPTTVANVTGTEKDDVASGTVASVPQTQKDINNAEIKERIGPDESQWSAEGTIAYLKASVKHLQETNAKLTFENQRMQLDREHDSRFVSRPVPRIPSPKRKLDDGYDGNGLTGLIKKVRGDEEVEEGFAIFH